MKNLVLIGFMGSGKSLVGRKLATQLNLAFVDTDILIEKKAQQSIRKIFEQTGEAYFRDLETQVIKEVSSKENQVIACGGGAVLRSQNVKALKKKGFLIYLKAPFPILFDRIKYTEDRPLLNVPQPERETKILLASRERIYQSVADMVVDASPPIPEEVVKRIILKLKEGENSEEKNLKRRRL